MLSKAKYLRYSLFLVTVLLFSSSFFLTMFGSGSSALILNKQTVLDDSEKIDLPDSIQDNSQFQTTE
ncbi:MAG: hypothetical protein ACTSP5_10145, partial [Candidatus Heimdallarchaeota archaeon]